MFLLLVVAGNETTRQAIAHGDAGAHGAPGRRWRGCGPIPALMPAAVEEILRWSTPVLHFRRTATRDVELRGTQIREGDKVVVWYASANFDERAFPDPLRFDITRSPNNHVTFGRGGPHFCLGAHLAQAGDQDHVRGAAPPAPGDRARRPAAAHPSPTSPTRSRRCLCASSQRERMSPWPRRTHDRRSRSARGVDTVRISYPDLHGIARGKEFPAAYVEHLAEDGRRICEAIMTVDLRHNVVAGLEHGFQDIVARPDLDTLVPVPWEHDTCLVPGRPLADGRLALRRRSARRAAPGGRGLRRARPDADRRPGARVLPVPARRTRRTAIGATSTTRATSTRSAASPTRAACCARCCTRAPTWAWARSRPTTSSAAASTRSTCTHCEALDAADRAFRFKAAVKEMAARAGPAGDVHRQALERRRGLRLPPAPVARRRSRRERVERPRRRRASPRSPARSSPGCSSTAPR